MITVSLQDYLADANEQHPTSVCFFLFFTERIFKDYHKTL